MIENNWHGEAARNLGTGIVKSPKACGLAKVATTLGGCQVLGATFADAFTNTRTDARSDLTKAMLTFEFRPGNRKVKWKLSGSDGDEVNAWNRPSKFFMAVQGAISRKKCLPMTLHEAIRERDSSALL